MRVLVLHSDIIPDAPPEELDTMIAAEAVAAALARKGHEVQMASFRAETLAGVLANAAPDTVFNLVEGVGGLGKFAPLAPKQLTELDARFTGATATAMDTTSDKARTKQMLRDAGLATPDWSVGPHWQGLDDRRWIVKSALEDASLGLDDGCVVQGREAVLRRAAWCAENYPGDWFAEEFVEGREFNISLLQEGAGVRIFPMAEMRFENWPAGKPRIVGYDAKWEEDPPAGTTLYAISGSRQKNLNWRRGCAKPASVSGIFSGCPVLCGWISASPRTACR